MKRISLLIPAYNEERSLPALYDALAPFMDAQAERGYEFDVFLVNDGSRDRTAEMLQSLRERDPRINYINLSRNFGKENAMLAGLDHVDGDCCIIMDADLQHPLGVIPEMIREWEKGYDDVYGRRLTRGRESWLRRRLTMVYYWLLRGSSRIEMEPNVGDFRLLDRRCIDALRSMREQQRYTKGLFWWIGFRKAEVAYETAPGLRDESTFSTRRLASLAMEGITGFSTAPLKIASVLGIVLSLLSMAYLIFIVFKTIFLGEEIQGFPTIMCTVLLLGGIQLLCIGIIGEYVGRIFIESKNRPPYLIDTINGEPPAPPGECAD